MRRFPLIRLVLLIVALVLVAHARGTLEVAWTLLWSCAVSFLFIAFPVGGRNGLEVAK